MRKVTLLTLMPAMLFFFAMGVLWEPAVAGSNRTLHIDIEHQIFIPTSIPTVTPLPDGSGLLRVTGQMSVSGDVVGTLSENVTQIIYPGPSGVRSSSVLWKLEAANGVIMEGYYSGHLKDIGEPEGESIIHSHGQVLAVTLPEGCPDCLPYADYYQAKVDAQALLNLTTFEVEGTIKIRPRSKR